MGHWWDGEGGQHHIQVFKASPQGIWIEYFEFQILSSPNILNIRVFKLSPPGIQIVSIAFKSSPNQIYWTSVMLYMYQYIYNVWFISSYYKFSEAAILVFSLDNPVRQQTLKFYLYFSHKNKYFQIFVFLFKRNTHFKYSGHLPHPLSAPAGHSHICWKCKNILVSMNIEKYVTKNKYILYYLSLICLILIFL